MRSSKFRDSFSLFVKCAGASLLLLYLVFIPFSFHSVWFLMSLLVVFIISLLYLLTFLHFGGSKILAYPFMQLEPGRNDAKIWNHRLAATELGVFILPLLIFGITPINVLITATFYGFYHYTNQLIGYGIMKAITFSIVCMWILPYGIWPVVASWALVDFILTLSLPKWLKTPSTQQNSPF
jgi:hypothetical protein